MNLPRLYQILGETTVQLRKGEVIHGDKPLVDAINAGVEHDKLPGGVVTFDLMPHESAAAPNIEKVDVEFMVVGVDRAAAERHKDELVSILKEYPEPERLARGPSYIEVGAVIGDQGAAFQLFAVGKVLGLWRVITPSMMGFTGAEAERMAGMGFVMVSGFSSAGSSFVLTDGGAR